MMLEADGVHPDEGTIHAWLDGALDAHESAGVESHVAGCVSCAARVAEARGLIAGASRVVGLLDEEPAPLIRPASTPTAGTGLSLWRLLRVTPARASIAAMLVVAVGITLTRERLGVDTRDARSRLPAIDTAASSTTRDGARPEAMMSANVPAPQANKAMSQDSVLSSAVSRRLAVEQPPRTLAPSPGVAIPTPPAEGSPVQMREMNSESKVLAARASMVAQRDSAGTRPDRTRAGAGQLSSASATAADRVVVAAKAADSVGMRAQSARLIGGLPGISPGECYRVESPTPAVWGSVGLPMIVVMDSAGTVARVLTATGVGTESRAFLQYNGADSARFLLRRTGFSGSMILLATGATRTGTIWSTTEPAKAPATDPIAITARRVRCPGS